MTQQDSRTELERMLEGTELHTRSAARAASRAMPSSVLATMTVASPLGDLELGATPRGLAVARFVSQVDESDEGVGGGAALSSGSGLTSATSHSPGAQQERAQAVQALEVAKAAFDEYFVDGSACLTPPDLDLGGTELQRAVWEALLAVPGGATCAYRDIAVAVGRPSAVRAVGAAIGANPVAILVPCHRVVGANGALTGYAGGLARKRWLLAHEGAMLSI